MSFAPATADIPRWTMRSTFVAIALFAFGIAQAQVLRLVRTDGGNPAAVTATRLFGVDVVADSLSDVTAVSFELRYDGARYIRLAAWKPRQLSQQNLYVIDRSDTATGVGSIHVGVIAGSGGYASPSVIHLDFAVTPDAPHGTVVTFSAPVAEAVVGGAQPRVVPLRSDTYAVVIHGFVNVYPGDANNDGRVDQRDFSTVALYLSGNAGSTRGYRREPASTLWQPQRALAWDDVVATYADCDGSGDITLADALVVKMNFDSTHSAAQTTGDGLLARREEIPLPAGGTSRIALQVPLSGVTALAVEFALPPGLHTDGMRSPEWHVDYFTYDPSTGKAWSVLSTEFPQDLPSIEVEFASSEPIPAVAVTQGYALLAGSRAIIPTGIITSVATEERNVPQCVHALYTDGKALTLELAAPARGALYNSSGQLCGTIELHAGEQAVDVSFLPSGIYWLRTTECTAAVLIAR